MGIGNSQNEDLEKQVGKYINPLTLGTFFSENNKLFGFENVTLFLFSQTNRNSIFATQMSYYKHFITTEILKNKLCAISLHRMYKSTIKNFRPNPYDLYFTSCLDLCKAPLIGPELFLPKES